MERAAEPRDQDEETSPTSSQTASQRQAGFKGGIQAGTTAATPESVGAEKLLRDAAEQAALAYTGIEWSNGLSGSKIKEALGVVNEDFQISGAYPDGGLYWHHKNGKLLVASEAKRQGAAGNAIERWYKNYAVAKALGVHNYITICVGDGFFDDNGAQRTMQLALALESSERHRCTGEIWNVQAGGIWLYRFRTLNELLGFDTETLLRAAITAALVAESDQKATSQ